MGLTLRDLLGFDVLRDADPEVLAGEESLDTPVGWVHSSEIYEIWPLLTGGELLLTTGLGLAGPDAGARRHYLRQLKEVGIAGLALELGRTFAQPPPELVEEARALGLPLIALRKVVPFIRISQVANTAILDAAATRLRQGEQISRALQDSLTAGAGVSGVLSTAGRLAGCPLVVLSAGGALLAMNGVSDHRAAWSVVDAGRLIEPILVHGHVWGRLLAGSGSRLPDDELADLLQRTSSALALAVLLTGSPPSQQDRQTASLLHELLEARPGDADYRLRAGMLGFHPRQRQQIVAIAVDGPESGPALALVDRAARALKTPRLAGRVGGTLLGLLVTPLSGSATGSGFVPADGAARAVGTAGRDPAGMGGRDPAGMGGRDVAGVGGRDVVGTVAAVVEEARSRFGVPELTAALGHAVPGDAGAGEVAASLRAARAALRLAVAERAGRPGGAPAVVTARELALELQLTGTGDADSLRAIARATLAPLIDWDSGHRSDLVRTLEVLLRHGGSPTRAAAALHLGRQSLYQRIERIETLLGHPVDDARLHSALLLAACAHRLSTPR